MKKFYVHSLLTEGNETYSMVIMIKAESVTAAKELFQAKYGTNLTITEIREE